MGSRHRSAAEFRWDGPSLTAEWVNLTLPSKGGGRALRLLRDEAAAPGFREQYYGIRLQPAVRRAGEGTPVVSLTLVLRRRPAPGEREIAPLVREAMLAFELELGLDDTDRQYAASKGYADVRRLFFRQLEFKLIVSEDVTGIERTVAMASATGTHGRVALATHLTAAEAQAVLTAIDGEEGGSRVEVSGSFRASGLTGMAERRIERRVPLHELLTEALEAQDQNSIIRLVAPGLDGIQAPVPPRTRARPQATRDGRPITLAADGNSMRATTLLAQPTADLHSPALLVASDLVRPLAFVGHFALLDLAASPADAPRSLPIVDDPSAPVWRDRIDSVLRWYVPEFDLVRPAADAVPAGSPFLFTVRSSGVTEDGSPALNATVKLTLRPRASAAILAAGGSKARAVPFLSVGAVVSVPFVDETTGAKRRQVVPAQVANSGGDLVLSVEVMSKLARLLYSAIAMPGPEAVLVEICVSFESYVPIQDRPGRLQLAAVGLTSKLQVARTDKESVALDGRVHVDLRVATLRYPTGEIRLRKEPLNPRLLAVPEVLDGIGNMFRPRAPALLTASMPMALGLHATPAAANTSVSVQPQGIQHVSTATTILARPEIMASQSIAELLRKVRYGTQTQIRKQPVRLVFPCDRYGSFYREETTNGNIAIGCREAYKLGRADLQSYGEMDDLSGPRLRVFRSLQQPGRFLVVPAAYRVTRYAPSVQSRAYRPAIAVFTALDVERPENNRIVFQATLQPDLVPAELAKVRAQLQAHSANPLVELPTELLTVTVDASLSLELGADVVAEVRRTPDGFQVSISTDLNSALLVLRMLETTGILGSAELTTPDGLTFICPLLVDVNQVVGPLPGGVVEVSASGNGIRLVNRAERPVEIADVVVYSNAAAPVRHPVETTLAPGASTDVSAEATGAVVEYGFPPGPSATIEEIRSFVEDVRTNVVFIDLIRYANHALQRLDLRVRMRRVPGEFPVRMSGDPPSGIIELTLPLTAYLAERVIEIQATKTFTSGEVANSPWIAWDLETSGNLVSVTWELFVESGN